MPEAFGARKPNEVMECVIGRGYWRMYSVCSRERKATLAEAESPHHRKHRVCAECGIAKAQDAFPSAVQAGGEGKRASRRCLGCARVKLAERACVCAVCGVVCGVWCAVCGAWCVV